MASYIGQFSSADEYYKSFARMALMQTPPGSGQSSVTAAEMKKAVGAKATAPLHQALEEERDKAMQGNLIKETVQAAQDIKDVFNGKFGRRPPTDYEKEQDAKAATAIDLWNQKEGQLKAMERQGEMDDRWQKIQADYKAAGLDSSGRPLPSQPPEMAITGHLLDLTVIW